MCCRLTISYLALSKAKTEFTNVFPKGYRKNKKQSIEHFHFGMSNFHEIKFPRKLRYWSIQILIKDFQ